VWPCHRLHHCCPVSWLKIPEHASGHFCCHAFAGLHEIGIDGIRRSSNLVQQDPEQLFGVDQTILVVRWVRMLSAALKSSCAICARASADAFSHRRARDRAIFCRHQAFGCCMPALCASCCALSQTRTLTCMHTPAAVVGVLTQTVAASACHVYLVSGTLVAITTGQKGQ
jgi:hypothetical protein